MQTKVVRFIVDCLYRSSGQSYVAGLLALVLFASVACAQIGGNYGTQGDLVLDDGEDGDLIADGVMRAWISDYVAPVGNVLSATDLTGTHLVLEPGQSPGGALYAQVPYSSTMKAIAGGFGVPLPALDGASTLEHPGDATTFDTLTARACFYPDLGDVTFQVILETYPGGPDYPTLYWSFSPAAGTAFQTFTLDLRTPSGQENTGGRSIEELLGQTRYLAFYLFSPTKNETVHFYLDDIRLTGLTPAGIVEWRLYGR